MGQSKGKGTKKAPKRARVDVAAALVGADRTGESVGAAVASLLEAEENDREVEWRIEEGAERFAEAIEARDPAERRTLLRRFFSSIARIEHAAELDLTDEEARS